MYFFFLCGQLSKDESLYTRIFILFRAAEKEVPYSKGLYSFFLVNILFTYAMYFFFLRGQKEKYQKERSRRPELPLPCQSKSLLNGCKLDGAVERCERSHIAAASTTVFNVSPSSVMLTQRSLP